MAEIGAFVVEFERDDAQVPMCSLTLRIGHFQFSMVALMMVTGVVGTSWNMPRLPVRTWRILSTTSAPATTLPNTA